MSAVPSLVGAGTIVAAAAAGLVVGQATESTSPRPTSKRKVTSDFETTRAPVTLSRPNTSTVAPSSAVEEFPYNSFQALNEPIPNPTSASFTRQPRFAGTLTTQTTPPKLNSRRQSFIRQGDLASHPIAEHSRDSISSNGSWMRRLSIRPLSQHGSPRSSILGPESASITFSLGSAAPILSPVGSLPPQLPPNKLVKRATSGVNSNSGSLSRRGSRSQMPTLRRPATSHQRSATLQQFQSQSEAAGPTPGPKYSLDQQSRPRQDLPRLQTDVPETSRRHVSWTSFFHARVTRSVGGSPARSNSSSPSSSLVPVRRVHLQAGSMPKACLIKPAMLSAEQPVPERHGEEPSQPDQAESSPGPKEVNDSPQPSEETPSKRARRSISMHFSSPTNWISRTGSIRRPKRGLAEAKGGKRSVSAPVAAEHLSQVEVKSAVAEGLTPAEYTQQDSDVAANVQAPTTTRRRNASSPLPPLTRLSSFNIDMSRLGQSTPSPNPARLAQPQSPPIALPQTYPALSQGRAPFGERTSTFASSDQEARDFLSADEDDTDFKSDTMFDSFRTMASNRLRSVETPLESMFDESPPSTAGNGKTKRLSIQEILGRSWDGDTKITEEDEGIPTPVREAQSSAGRNGFHSRDDSVDDDFAFETTSQDFSFANRDFGRVSLDDDDDEDWARDDENTLSNHLSPPSTVNSRGASPNLRMALASISGNSSPENHHLDYGRERPRSNIFDWSEPSAHDKLDASGTSPRPKTVHGKQEMDLRGGRPTNRKGPTATHVRSQSVPVVADPAEPSKSTPKFGTWGLSTKTASEDWGDDFELGPIEAGGKSSTKSAAVVVPPSIQAAQSTVKAHSGQIRELSLLVNDLKRLCRHGRDLDILDSQSAPKWKEAESIIALASPDEEMAEGAEEPPSSSSSNESPEDKFLGRGFDTALDKVQDPFEAREPEIAKTTVVRERQVVRRRSVFSPDDDIFGGSWPTSDDDAKSDRPRTPDHRNVHRHDSAVIASVMEAMQQQRSASDPVKSGSPSKIPQSKLFFDTNSLQELVKRASHLRDSLSDLVRRAELLTQSPAGTPRRERHNRQESSPAFTRVFSNKNSVDSTRMQMMTVS